VLARLFLLFTLVPLIELYVLILFTQWTGSFPLTLGIVVGTGMVGAFLARQQGWRTWLEIQQQLAAGKMPTKAVQEGVLILLAGALLVTPGLLSDMTGIVLLIPPARRGIRRWLAARMATQVTWTMPRSAPGRSGNTYNTTFEDPPVGESPRHRVIDVQVLEANDDTAQRP
jgi:UPF0716 protein FxsA